MNKYRVIVNGTEYEVEIEKITGDAPFASAPETKAPAAPAGGVGGDRIAAPIPGTILSVKAASGQKVKSGQVLMILEAMKMENEIMAPFDGTVTTVNVKEGDNVESGTLLCTITK